MNEQGSEQDLDVPPRGRGIYLLPNMLTTTALFAGLYAVIAAQAGHFETAALSTLVALVFDGLDGRVARLTHTSTRFGAEYDSMADMVSFGVAPAMLMYFWSLQYAPGSGVRQIGWIVAFVFVACAGLRLARFNVQVGKADKRFFQGLPSPSAAMLLSTYVWCASLFEWDPLQLLIPSLLLTIFAGLLMVSNFAYYSFKDFDGTRKVPFVATFVIVVGFAVVSLQPPLLLFLCFSVYALSGPVLSLRRWRRR